MAAPRSTRVTRSSVGINGLDENFCGRTLRNRSIAQPEESSAVPLPRARSPKKQQPPQKGPLSGRQVPEEQWLSPRKRVVSCSETEGGERRGPPEASPIQKRAKHSSHSGDAPGSDEDSPGKAERPARDPTEAPRTPAESDEDAPPSRPDRLGPSPDDQDQDENVSVAAGGNDLPEPPDEPHKVTNGLDGRRSTDAEACPQSAEPSPGDACAPSEECRAVPAGARNNNLALPNGRQADLTLPSDPHVPCKNSHPERAEPDGPVMATEDSRAPQPHAPAAPAPPGALPPAREPEEEVDVVGDAGSRLQERAPDSTNGGLGSAQDGSHISGEAEPPAPANPAPTPEPEAAPDPTPTPTPNDTSSFTEPQEHRYTLRTSPRRPACSKPPSPSMGNGPHKEDDGQAGQAEEASPKADELPSSGRGPAGEQVTECSGEVTDTAVGEAGVSEGSVSKSTKEPAGSQTAEEEEDEEDPDVYYFESDHLALKHNKDYQRLLQAISVLEAQRTQAIMDLETLARHQREALQDPISFVEKLQKQVGQGLPCPQRVVQLPEIAWDQYTSGLGDFEREFRDKKRNTRRLKLIFDKVGLPARPKSPLDSKKEGEPSAIYSALPSSDAPEHSASSSRTQQMIRGRVCDQNKPDTFNQLWTVEEQKRLEQLLLKFPPEEVESKRWQKIADELGNRTAKQVASRVQKYFIKLTKAGIPVPGRTPNLCMYSKKASSKRQHHLNKHLYRPSTFLTSYEPPVYMDDEDDRSSFYSGMQDPTAEDSDEDGIPMEYRSLPEYKELLELKKLKKHKIQEIHAENALAQHMGYKCDVCGTEPIQGVRWHCRDCPQDVAIDFCSNCSDCLYKTETHKPNHQLEPVFQSDMFLDRDYCLPQSTGYNYLDPNYFPANR